MEGRTGVKFVAADIERMRCAPGMIVRFEHDYLKPRVREQCGRAQAPDARADNHNVGIDSSVPGGIDADIGGTWCGCR